MSALRQRTVREASYGDRNSGQRDDAVVITLRAYFDDSSDERHKQFAAVGGLIAAPGPWQVFDKKWGSETYELKAPFHATDCEAQRGAFKGWSVDQSRRLMKTLVGVIRDSCVMGFGAIVPVAEYQSVFPDRAKHDPYFLAVKQMVVNMGRIGLDIATGNHQKVEIKVWVEKGDTSGRAVDILQKLTGLASWEAGRYFTDFGIKGKDIMAMQGADLIAREAFKHASNLGVRRTRMPVQVLKDRLSFHLWTRESLEYLRTWGGPDNLDLLTHWGQQGVKVPQMIRFHGSTFDKR